MSDVPQAPPQQAPPQQAPPLEAPPRVELPLGDESGRGGGRLIAIGDIHGCAAALKALLHTIDPQPADTIVTLGDYVDRGPDSRGVVDMLLDLRRRCHLIPLMGNHEEMMLDVIDGNAPHHGWLRHGGLQTLESYDFSGDLKFLPPEHEEFFKSLGDYYLTDRYAFTHAAYDPATPWREQSIDALRWQSLRDGLPEPHQDGRTVVVGHTADYDGEVLDIGHLICLDTRCFGDGYLTAMNMDTRELWQAKKCGQLVT